MGEAVAIYGRHDVVGFVCDDAMCDGSCAICNGTIGLVRRLSCLASNLAIAAGLCRAFTQGWNQNIHVRFGEENKFWSPGCGRSAPESGGE